LAAVPLRLQIAPTGSGAPRSGGRGGLAVPTAAAAALAGAAFALAPVPVVAVVLVGVLAAIAFGHPLVALCVGAASSAVSLEYFDSLASMETALARGHRLLVMAALAPILLRRGLRKRVLPMPILAYALLFLLTYSLAGREAGLSVDKSVFALATLSLGWMAGQVRWRRREIVPVLVVIALTPILCVVAGYLLQVGGVREAVFHEYTGVDRLQGASIPAYLGFLAAGGAAASVALTHVGARRLGIALAVAGLAIGVLTGTRGAILACALIVVPIVSMFVRGHGRGGPGVVVRASLVVAVVALGASLFAPVVLARTFTSEADGGVDGSGRAEAWDYYLESTSGSRGFGRGLGAAPVLGEKGNEHLRGDFRGAHSEYVRLYVEGGIVGLTLVVVAVVLHLRMHYRATPRRLRPSFLALALAFAAYSAVDNTVSSFHLFVPFGIVIGIYSWVGAREGAGYDASAAVA
jgi:teichuronic acid biosynthesis protein TuaE